MFLTWNRIQINKGFEESFEQRQQETQREEVPGRLFVARLRADEPGVYINMAVWESRQAFETWRGSEAFKRFHSGGSPQGEVAGPPQVTLAEVLSSEGSLILQPR